MTLVDRFTEIEHELPADWSDGSLTLTIADDARCERAAALLGPANPGRLGKTIRFNVTRRGGGVAPDGVRRLLRRLDAEGIDGRLDLVATSEVAAAELPRQERLRAAWERALASSPSDWSDIYAEVRFNSTDYIQPAALLMAPLNPSRYGGVATLRFRCAHHFGYGASPEMTGRCLQRCDEAGLTGEVEILRVLSDSYPVGSQGPVWLVGGKSV